MYLQEDVQPDNPYYESEVVYLKIRNGDGVEYKRFGALSNIFCIQGDGRWWRDHRCPGGIMISTNSIGHYAFRHANPRICQLGNPHLSRVLTTAMDTISEAYRGSGEPVAPLPATRLKPTEDGFDKANYEGYYHTDHLVPSVYFNPAISASPADLRLYTDLDFTYIWDDTSPYHSSLIAGVNTARQEVMRAVLDYPDYHIEEDFPFGKQKAVLEYLEREMATKLRIQVDKENWMMYRLPSGIPDLRIEP
jgi:hypothetical protein